jgi:hypothetical protein
MKKRLSRAKRNIARRLNNQLDRLCGEAHIRLNERVEAAQQAGDYSSRTVFAEADTVGRDLYAKAAGIKKRMKKHGLL